LDWGLGAFDRVMKRVPEGEKTTSDASIGVSVSGRRALRSPN
jgi:hypothetical protein